MADFWTSSFYSTSAKCWREPARLKCCLILQLNIGKGWTEKAFLLPCSSHALAEVQAAFEPAERSLKQSQKTWDVAMGSSEGAAGVTQPLGGRGTCPEEQSINPPGTEQSWLEEAQQLRFPASEALSSVLAEGMGWWLLCRHKARIVPRGPRGLSYGEAEQLKTWAGSEENEV